jgi:hypothetical protein
MGANLASANIYHLKHADYSERGQTVEIIVDGVPKRQTIIFSGTDYFGEKYYFTEEGLRYITDSRNERPDQELILKYLDKIPTILNAPLFIGRNLKKPENLLYFKDFAIKERLYRKFLFIAILKKSNINVAWNFYYLSENKVPKKVEVIYRNQRSAKYLR